MRQIAMLAGALLLPLSAQAQTESFIVRAGKDTIAVERFTLTPSRLDGEFSMRGSPLRWKYYGDIVNGRVPILYTSVFSGADTVAAQTAATRFQNDSAIVEIMTKGTSTTQRLTTSPGALPLINLAFSFVEIVTRNLRADTATVSFFLINGGQTVTAALKRPRADSVIVAISGTDLVVNVDSAGRILRGNVPAQNVTVERVGTAARLSEKKIDYSAPPNASYSAQHVRISTPGGHRLAGTLTLPRERQGRVPVVVTISGSGLQDRDEALIGVNGYRPFRQIADALGQRGIAVLRYDDRGFGESSGNAATATTADFADDVRAVLNYLRARSEVDTTKMLLLGHSEGAIIAPAVAATDHTLRGLILMAAPSRVGRRIIEYQNRNLIDQLPNLTTTQRDSMANASRMQLDSVASRQPWVGYFLSYDPLPAARKVTAPVLILHGATDRQVTADQAEELAAALRSARNSDVTVNVLPGVNHLFLKDASGNPAGYAALPDKRLVSNVVDMIVDWVLKHTK